MDRQEVIAPQQEVQRLLGRCMLRLQQYEKLMKAILAHHDISGPAQELDQRRDARIEDISTNSLGQVVAKLMGSYLVRDGEVEAAKDAIHSTDDITISMRVQIQMSKEDHARTTASLRELVLLRNGLVHHFIDQFDLWSVDGCASANEHLKGKRPVKAS